MSWMKHKEARKSERLGRLRTRATRDDESKRRRRSGTLDDAWSLRAEEAARGISIGGSGTDEDDGEAGHGFIAEDGG